MKYIQYFLLLSFVFLQTPQLQAAPTCACNHLDLSCDPTTEYAWFRHNSCVNNPWPAPTFTDHLCECKSKPSNACIPRIETTSPTNISGTACGSGGTYWCDRPHGGSPVSWTCFCVGCGSPPATCDLEETKEVQVDLIPMSFTLKNIRDAACGGNPDLPEETTYEITEIPYALPTGSSIPELNFVSNRFTYTWRGASSAPPPPPPPPPPIVSCSTLPGYTPTPTCECVLSSRTLTEICEDFYGIPYPTGCRPVYVNCNASCPAGRDPACIGIR